MMFGLTDVILAKESPQGAARLLGAMFETCLERLEGLCIVYEEVTTSLERSKQKAGEVFIDTAFIEKVRPIGGATYAVEKPEDVIHGTFFFTGCDNRVPPHLPCLKSLAWCLGHFCMVSVSA